MANPKGNPQNLKPVRTEKEAKKRGAAGGKKSGEARRKKRDAQEALRMVLNMAAAGPLDQKLKGLGFAEEDRTNMTGATVALFMKAASGDIAAYKTMMDYAGYHPDQKQRDKESDARIRKMDEGVYRPSGGDPDDDEAVDVMIVLPDNGRGSGPKPVQEPPESPENEEEGDDE